MKAVHYDSIYEIVLKGESELLAAKIGRIASLVLDRDSVYQGTILILESDFHHFSRKGLPTEGVRIRNMRSHPHRYDNNLRIRLSKDAYNTLESTRYYETTHSDLGTVRISVV